MQLNTIFQVGCRIGRIGGSQPRHGRAVCSTQRATMAVAKNVFSLMARRLGNSVPLPEACERAILGLPVIIRTIEASQDIRFEGGTANHCCVILDGWACCYQSLTDGRRQILSFHVPGDLPDLQSLNTPTADFGMATVTRTIVAFVPHAEMRKLSDQYPAITQALWREAVTIAATHRAWITSLGRRDARQKLAHLFCELYLRLEAVGLNDGRSISMPLRQTDFADALGLTSVHVNRTLKILRDDGVIDLYARRLTIGDWNTLCAIAEFDPKYLHLAH